VGGQPDSDFVHDPATGALIGDFLNGAVQGAVAPSPDGKLIASGSHDDGMGIWDAETAVRISQLASTTWGSELSWAPNGTLLATTIGTSIQLWNVAHPRQPTVLRTIPTDLHAPDDYLSFSPDGRWLVFASYASGQISAINVATKSVAWAYTTTGPQVGQVAISPDNKSLAIDSGDSGKGQLTLLDLTNGHPQRTLPLQSYGGVSYLQHGRWLVVTGNQATPQAQLYDTATLQPIGVPFPTTDAFGNPIGVNSAGTLFSEAEGFDPILWNVDPHHWVRLACNIAGRNLTRSEWQQYLPDRPYHSTCPQWPAGT
jgi:WD40 repeat protein